MKAVFTKIIATLLTFLVLISTVSFTIERHYCGRILVDTAVFSKAKDCGMHAMKSYACSTELEVDKKSCCKNEQTIIKGQDELKHTYDIFDLLAQDYDVLATEANVHFVFDLPGVPLNEYKYSPPDIVKDVIVLHETYLI